MANIVYIATSLDGFIADKDGGLDWLNDLPNPTGSDYGFSDFMGRVDAILMGRKTYEKVLSFDCDWPYSKKVFVLSNNLSEVDNSLKGKVEIIKGELKTLVRKLNDDGFKNLYIDGGITIQNFLKEGLIDELIITRVPIILGGGISLFASLENSLTLEHVNTEIFDNGLVKSRYLKK